MEFKEGDLIYNQNTRMIYKFLEYVFENQKAIVRNIVNDNTWTHLTKHMRLANKEEVAYAIAERINK